MSGLVLRTGYGHGVDVRCDRSTPSGDGNINVLTSVSEFLRRRLNTLGYDLVRHPSSRLRSGQTALVIEQLAVDCVVDAGANVGQYGTFVRSIGYRGPIVSFEPVPALADQLRVLASRDGNWTVCQTALGSAAGEATINITRAPVMSSLRTPTTTSRAHIGTDIDVVDTEVVPVRRLDEVLPEVVGADARIFLKMSVQGWDLEVLAGATRCLEQIVAIMSIVSVDPLYDGMPDWLESLTAMRALGYVPTGMFPVLHVGPLHVAEFDAVMVRPLADD